MLSIGGGYQTREREMMRKVMIVLAAAAAIGTALVSTEASARGGHGFGGFHGGFHGGGFHHFHHGFRGGFFFGPGFGYWGYPYSYSGYYDECLQVRRVPTRYGWRWRRIWVCG